MHKLKLHQKMQEIAFQSLESQFLYGTLIFKELHQFQKCYSATVFGRTMIKLQTVRKTKKRFYI